MKVLMMALLLSFSSQSFAYSATESILGTSIILTVTSAGTSQTDGFKAEEIIRDANEYYLNGGKASTYLAQQIKDIQKGMEVSDDEAVDLLVSVAKEQLNLNY